MTEVRLDEYEKLNPGVTVNSNQGPVVYCTPNLQTYWRVDTLFTKEPDTIEWLGSFQPGEILFDVGANVGMYSIWAAKTRGTIVYAFEPESQNYALLNKNIITNNLGDNISAYCVALGNTTGFNKLYLSSFMIGGSCHNFGEQRNFHHEVVTFPHSQGCFSTTIDQIIANQVAPVPDHVKIDVDGNEHFVIEGGRQTFSNPKVKSVLVEINGHLEKHREIIEYFLSIGYKYSEEQAEQSKQIDGPFKGIGNYVFRR